MDLISIIVPIFNVATYIEECVISLINQSYVNIEIILINDCSTDNSLEICERLAQTDNRIRVFSNEKNEGVSISRNRGIALANGKYILFVDGDDIVDIQLCEMAMNEIWEKGVDTVHWGYKKFSNTTKEVIYERDPIMCDANIIEQPEIREKFLTYFTISYDDLYNWFTSRRGFDEAIYNLKQPGYCFRYLMSKDVIKLNKLHFCEGLGYGEDLIFVSEYLLCCSNIAILNKKLYFYRDRPNSIMHTKHSVDEKISSIMKKNNILYYVQQDKREEIAKLWKGQIVLIALNGARVHTLGEYKKLLSYPCVKDAIAGLKILKAPLQYKIAIGLLKMRMVAFYYIIIKVLSRGGFKYER